MQTHFFNKIDKPTLNLLISHILPYIFNYLLRHILSFYLKHILINVLYFNITTVFRVFNYINVSKPIKMFRNLKHIHCWFSLAELVHLLRLLELQVDDVGGDAVAVDLFVFGNDVAFV